MRKALAMCGVLLITSLGFGAEDRIAAVQKDFNALVTSTRAERDRLTQECNGHVAQILAELERQKGTGEELSARKAVLDQLRGLHAQCVEKRQALAARYTQRKQEILAKLPADQRDQRDFQQLVPPQPMQMTGVDAQP